MQSFDIYSLLSFTPARYMCRKCYGLNNGLPMKEGTDYAQCPNCGVRYVSSSQQYMYTGRVSKHLSDFGLQINRNNVFADARELATIAARARTYLKNPTDTFDDYPPLRALFEALATAKSFVHFVTYGISPMLIGALKLTAQHVPVKGIISNVDAHVKEELATYGVEAPGLKVKLFERSNNPKDWDAAPHQKLVVIDGLLAFKGSTNLTQSGWRKAAEGRDVIEFETDVRAVTELHNRYFSPVWASFDDTSVYDIDDVPF